MWVGGCFGCVGLVQPGCTCPFKAELLWWAGMGKQAGNLQSYPRRCMAGIRLLKARCTQLQHALTGSGGEGWGWEGFGSAGGDPRVKTPPGVSAGSRPSLLAECQTHSDHSPVAGIVMQHMMGIGQVFQWVFCWIESDDLVTPLLHHHLQLDKNYPNALLHIWGAVDLQQVEGSLEKIVNVEHWARFYSDLHE